MAAKFRAINENDLKQYSPVRNRYMANNFGALNYQSMGSRAMIDDYSDTAEFYLNDKAYVRTYFSLVVPTFNFVLSESGANLLRRLLGVKKDDWESILKFTKIYDQDLDMLVEARNAETSGRYLYGAQIAKKYIDDFDFEKEIEKSIMKACSKVLSANSDPYDVFKLNRSKKGMHVAADYYVDYDLGVLLGAKKRGFDLEEMQSSIQYVLMHRPNNRFTLLYNMHGDKSRLYGMLNFHIVVVPSELRPKEENREHQLTKRYAQVVTYNEEMRMNLFSPPQQVISSYYKLEHAVELLQYKIQGAANARPDDRSLMERIKTKKGQIRNRNLGRRQDYSARAVVCINPYLPVDVIRVPKAIIPKLYEHHALPYLTKHLEENKKHIEDGTHVDNRYDKISMSALGNNNAKKAILDLLIRNRVLEHVPCVMGRQPTLHKQSLQGFHVEPTDLTAIEVNPTVCPAFNMDFDGDQAHLEVPLSEDAIREVSDLLMTTQNLFLAKDGSVTTVPRMDMLYGLYICTKDTYSKGSATLAYNTLEEIRQAVMKHKVKPWETVITPKDGTQLAGDAAFMACFPEGDIVPRGKSIAGKLPVMQVDKKTIGKYMDYALRVDMSGNFVYPLGSGYAPVNTIVGIINRLVELGFKVASLYPPNMSLLQDSFMNVKHDDVLNKFHEDVEDIELLYDLGLETHDRYSFKYEQRVTEVMSYYKNDLVKSLEDDNGYRVLMESGARGNADNLRQTFGIKGRVQKNDSESFDAIVENSYATQLTSMESLVDAYGGRQGQIDKSLKTGDTGYMMRKMWHATQGIHITTQDCGTTKGLKIRKADLRLLSTAESEDAIQKDVTSIFKHAITGRFRVGENIIINEDRAERLANDPNVTEIEIRSPIHCNKPCCQRCYGIDWSTHKIAAVGLPVGFIAAQSIGEPGTQLVLKNFQKGGIVTAGNITSAFDKVDTYLRVSDLKELSDRGAYSGYDPIAWADGKIEELPTKNPRTKYIKIEGHSRKIEVPDSLIVHEYAHKGQGLSTNHGDYSLRELLKYAGIEFTQFYLAFKLFALYRSEIEIKMCHFEVLVSAMTRYMITSTDRKDLMVGQYCSRTELLRGDISNTTYIPRLIATKAIPEASMSALDAIVMEDQVEGLSRVCALQLTDDLTKPINSMVMSQTIQDGSAYPNFIADRKIQV